MARALVSFDRWHVLYPRTYVAYLALSVADVLITYMVLADGGREINLIANWFLERFDFAGMVLFKFALVGLVLANIEVVGRLRPGAGRFLAVLIVLSGITPLVVVGSQAALHSPEIQLAVQSMISPLAMP
jgi:hypothetical protein